MMETVGAERREKRKIGFVLEEETKVPQRLSGRVTGWEVVAENAVQHESVTLRFVRVFDRGRKRLVVNERNVWCRDEDTLLLGLFPFIVRLDRHARSFALPGLESRRGTLERLRSDETRDVAPGCTDPTLRRWFRSTDDLRVDERSTSSSSRGTL